MSESDEPAHCPTIWNVLHDATIVDVTGAVPGMLRLEIECDYLRDRFEDPGDRFFLTLRDCDRFIYRPWADGAEPIADLQTMSHRRLWILSADPVEGLCKVHCSEHIPHGSGGILEVSAGSASLSLDGERSITLSELEGVAGEYWTEFNSSQKNE